MDLRTTYDGIAKRARQIERHMRKATTVVVTTSDPAPMREAVRFFHALPEVASRPAAVFFNRSLPETWIDARPPRGTEAALAANLARWGVEAQKQRSARRELGERHGVAIVTVPWQRRPPTDLDSLAEMIETAGSLPQLW